MKLSLLAAALGLAVSWIVGRVLASQLSEIKPFDPLSLVFATAMLLAVAGTAVYLPVRRAASVDPIKALRQE